MDAGQISERLAKNVEEIVLHLLPNGKRRGREWCVGSVNGERGESLKVCLSGSKAGIWSDFATGDSGDLLDLWSVVSGLPISKVLPEARSFLGLSPPEKVFKKTDTYCRPKRPDGLTKPRSKVTDYLSSRYLSQKSIEAYQVGEIAKRGSEIGPWIVFPYLKGDTNVFIKYLHLERNGGKKQIRAEANCEPILFGMHVVPERHRTLAITEGEIDAMSLFEYGIPSVSVPFGGGGGNKHRWIDNCYEWLERFSEIYLVMDNDSEGLTAAKDIAHRLGLHRCKLVALPEKDANECLIAGITKEEIDSCFEDASNFDPEELKPARSYVDGVIDRFYPKDGERPGINLPWKKTQNKIRLYDGEVSIWTGINGHGKSLLLGQVMLGAVEQGKVCCIASMEMHPEKTLTRMIQQVTRKSCPAPTLIHEAMEGLDGALWIFDLVGTAKQERLLEVFKYAFHRYGVRQFVIDSLSKCGVGEDDYNAQKGIVDLLGDFAKSTGSHVHLVAHSRKGADEFNPPGKMDVKGTGALTDMADNVLCVHRNKAKERDLAIIENGGSVRGKTPADISREYDAFLCCDKHRENGADAEGMYGLFFNRESLLFCEQH